MRYKPQTLEAGFLADVDEEYARIAARVDGKSSTGLRKGDAMKSVGDGLGSVVHSALIQAAGYRRALVDAHAAFVAGDDEKGKLLVNNAASGIGGGPANGDPLDSPDAVKYMVVQAMQDGGEPVSGY